MNILITGGPTNEKIDEVMKITNMSTGNLAVKLARQLYSLGHNITLIINKKCDFSTLLSALSNRMHIITMEDTQDLIGAVENVAVSQKIDLVIHSAAVADYKADFSFKMEDMAKEIVENIFEEFKYPEEATTNELVQNVLNTLCNPSCKVCDDTKISSCEPNLTIKLGLTPKVIASLRKLFPDAKICGFKLLENVSKDELFAVATKLANKNNIDYVFANDLKDLREGNSARYVVTKDGYTGKELDDIYEIATFIELSIFSD